MKNDKSLKLVSYRHMVRSIHLLIISVVSGGGVYLVMAVSYVVISHQRALQCKPLA